MLSWVVLNFIFVIYSSATQLTYSLIGLLGMAIMVIWIGSVLPSVQKFSSNWLYSFNSGNQHDVGAHVVLCMTGPDFLKIMFCPQNGENRPSPGFFECIRKFSFIFSVLYFFINWSIMKVYITAILVCLKKFLIWENSGSWGMAQNVLGQSDGRIFQSIAGL